MLTYGVWQVTTEGDCEGRSVRNLGIYEGNVDDIAFHLADKVMYGLEFKLVEPIRVDDTMPTETEVNITFRNDRWNRLNDQERVTTIKELLYDRGVDVARGMYYNSVKISKRMTPEEKEAARIATIHARAVAKLTDEERRVLGIK